MVCGFRLAGCAMSHHSHGCVAIHVRKQAFFFFLNENYTDILMGCYLFAVRMLVDKLIPPSSIISCAFVYIIHPIRWLISLEFNLGIIIYYVLEGFSNLLLAADLFL